MPKQIRKSDHEYIIMSKVGMRSGESSLLDKTPSSTTQRDYQFFGGGMSAGGGSDMGTGVRRGIDAVVINSAGDEEIRQQLLIQGDSGLVITEDIDKQAFILHTDEYTDVYSVFKET